MIDDPEGGRGVDDSGTVGGGFEAFLVCLYVGLAGFFRVFLNEGNFLLGRYGNCSGSHCCSYAVTVEG